ncbi:MAG: DUF2794 domain-containing protein [Hyphomicrobiales bacterium]|nr:DUF2794 domain-containing protein [Hyphomicrobiales bacterium]
MLARSPEASHHADSRTREGPLSEAEDQEPYRGGGRVLALTARNQNQRFIPPISFDKRELNQILNVYGRKVADGEWRDYAIDQLKEKAVFSVFRRASEVPIYQIVKQPKLARRQGAYSLVTATGQILKRGHDLANVLRVIDRPLRLVVA